MIDLMIHDFDYARWVAGEVETVYAKNITSMNNQGDIDYGLVILAHENNTLSHIEGAWAYPAPYFRTQMQISGSKGWLEMDSNQTTPTKFHLRNENSAVPEIPLHRRSLKENIHTTQIKAFYSSILNKTDPPVSGEEGLAALQIACAALQSAEEGIPVTLNRLAGSQR